jgi:MoxR-like ATPase
MPDHSARHFKGQGRPDDGVERRWCTETRAAEECQRLMAAGRMDDPAAYEADPGLVDAVNVALLLGRPLLLTGRPGTGKSQLADRLAWEFDLAPVLRFEAQSVSEARDLFYGFDMVGRMSVAGAGGAGAVDPRRFITLAALGKAALYSHPASRAQEAGLALQPPHPRPASGRASVVLIDEIDKASRDFPNDLLNAIEKLSVPVPEVPGLSLEAAADLDRRPMLVITSNSERELPEPFLRRCVYYHIPDPTPARLRQIVLARVLRHHSGPPGSAPAVVDGKPSKLFDELVACFHAYGLKAAREASFTPGTSELIDLARVLVGDAEVRFDKPLADDANRARVDRAAAAVAKGKGDRDVFVRHLRTWKPESA